MELNTTQKATLNTLVSKVVALDKAEKAFDTSSKAIISLYMELVDSIEKGTLKTKGKEVHDTLTVELKHKEASLDTHIYKRVVSVVDTVALYIAKGVKLKTELIPFTLIAKVTDLLSEGYISKKQVDKQYPKEGAEYKKGLEDLVTQGSYKKLVGSADYSMLDDDTITLVKSLDTASLKGLSALVKVQMGA